MEKFFQLLRAFYRFVFGRKIYLALRSWEELYLEKFGQRVELTGTRVSKRPEGDCELLVVKMPDQALINAVTPRDGGATIVVNGSTRGIRSVREAGTKPYAVWVQSRGEIRDITVAEAILLALKEGRPGMIICRGSYNQQREYFPAVAVMEDGSIKILGIDAEVVIAA